jgi:Ni/Co efflux regulator RcnB
LEVPPGFGRQHDYYRARGRGVGPNYEYYRGDRLPYEYRHRNYVVNDWRDHRLSAPPYGYHWIQSGDDYILVAIATGIIAQILLSH